MVAPEWFTENAGTVSGAFPSAAAAVSAVADGREDVSIEAAMSCTDPRGNSAGLVQVGLEALRRCGEFFDPVVLANLDAALAHELASRAGNRAADATQALESAIRESRPAEALTHLAHRASASKGSESKASSRAAEATAVITRLGGTATERGYDPETVDGVSAACLVDAIAVMEEAKNALSAAQAQAQSLLVARQRLNQARSGVPQGKLGRGIIQQVALARHESPHRGRQLAELAEVLVREMPHTMNALIRGKINEYRATIVARETACLSYEDRGKVDQLMCGDANAVALLGNRELAAASKKAAYALDPEAFVKRQRKAVGDRYVSLRPAPDGMTFLTALIPLKQGVRILATLTRVAHSAKAGGDERGKGQLMADALMHRLIQHAPCDAGAGTISDHRGVPADEPELAVALARGVGASSSLATGSSLGTGSGCIGGGSASDQLCAQTNDPDIALELIMTDRALFGGANDPAILVGYDPIPASIARGMVLGEASVEKTHGDGEGKQGGHGAGAWSPRVWLKRLFTHPDSNALLAMDSKARLFPAGMQEFLRLQDQRCSEPYCDAPIREYDHVKSYAAGGPTSMVNGQGMCTSCNLDKEAPGWSSTRIAGGANGPPRTEIKTPTGHRYVSTAPPLPGPVGRQ